MAQMAWDETSDPQNPGWVVLTETAGWQPLGGDKDSDGDATEADLEAQARMTLAWHDGA